MAIYLGEVPLAPHISDTSVQDVYLGDVLIWSNWEEYSFSGSGYDPTYYSYTYTIPDNVRITRVVAQYIGRGSSAGTPAGSSSIYLNGTQVAKDNGIGYAICEYTVEEPIVGGNVIEVVATGQNFGWEDTTTLDYSFYGEIR